MRVNCCDKIMIVEQIIQKSSFQSKVLFCTHKRIPLEIKFMCKIKIELNLYKFDKNVCQLRKKSILPLTNNTQRGMSSINSFVILWLLKMTACFLTVFACKYNARLTYWSKQVAPSSQSLKGIAPSFTYTYLYIHDMCQSF